MGKASSGEDFCIDLGKEFYIKNDLNSNIQIALGNGLSSVDNEPSVSSPSVV